LWVIDQNGVIRRIGYLRRDDPTNAMACYMQAYQNDLWILQGKFVWRYSLASGGLFLEYQLNPGLETNQRAIAVVQGHTFACFSQEDASNTAGVVWVTGSVSTYRQAAVADGNSFTSSVYDYSLPGEDKLLRSIQVITDTMATDTSVTVQIQTDQSGTWTTIGTHSSGAETKFVVSNTDTSTVFKTIQMRIKLSSQTGSATPTLKAVVVDSLPLVQEEFFDLMIRTEDEDSSDHIGAQTLSGGDIAQGLWSLWRSGTPVTFIDGFQHSVLDNNPEYLVRVEDCDHSNDEIGEGRMSVRLRVLA
jgi:hypothetical protein